jgi:hypothetical protein
VFFRKDTRAGDDCEATRVDIATTKCDNVGMGAVLSRTERKKLFYNAVDDHTHRIFLYLFFSEEHHNFAVLRVDRNGDDLIETEIPVPQFVESATTAERQAFSELVQLFVSL